MGDACDLDDNDTFADSVENYIGIDSLGGCPDNPSHYAWPPDMSEDGRVDIVDVLRFKLAVPSRTGDSDYDRRLDPDADGMMDIVDVLKLKSFPTASCSQ